MCLLAYIKKQHELRLGQKKIRPIQVFTIIRILRVFVIEYLIQVKLQRRVIFFCLQGDFLQSPSNWFLKNITANIIILTVQQGTSFRVMHFCAFPHLQPSNTVFCVTKVASDINRSSIIWLQKKGTLTVSNVSQNVFGMKYFTFLLPKATVTYLWTERVLYTSLELEIKH